MIVPLTLLATAFLVAVGVSIGCIVCKRLKKRIELILHSPRARTYHVAEEDEKDPLCSEDDTAVEA